MQQFIFNLKIIKENQNLKHLQGIIGYLRLNDDILNPADFIISPFGEYDAFSQNVSGTYI